MQDAMQNPNPAFHEIDALEAEAVRAAQSGWDEEANRLWARILQLDPAHARTLAALGQRAFRKGDMESARAAFRRLVDADGSDPQQWIDLALACQNLRDEPGEETAL